MAETVEQPDVNARLLQLMEKEELANAAKLAKKIHAVMCSVRSIEKKGWNEHFKFAYVKHVDALEAVRTAAMEAGFVILASIVHVEQSQTGGMQGSGDKAKPLYRTVVRKQYDMLDTETGYCRSATHAGESIEAEDKGLSKANTSCDKYFLMSCFMIPSDVEPDGNSEAAAAIRNGGSGGRAAAQTSANLPDAFGFRPPKWPHEKAFKDPITDAQRKGVIKAGEADGLTNGKLQAFIHVVCEAFGVPKDTKGGASLMMDFFHQASPDSKKAARRKAEDVSTWSK